MEVIDDHVSLAEIARVLSIHRAGILFKNDIIKIDEFYVSFDFRFPHHYDDYEDDDKFYCLKTELNLKLTGDVNVHTKHYKIVDDNFRIHYCGIVGPTGVYDFKNVALVNKKCGTCYDHELNIIPPTYAINLPEVHYIKNKSICLPLADITVFGDKCTDGLFTPIASANDVFRFLNNCKYMFIERMEEIDFKGSREPLHSNLLPYRIREFLLSEFGELTELRPYKAN
jgi:hypothetical protein